MQKKAAAPEETALEAAIAQQGPQNVEQPVEPTGEVATPGAGEPGDVMDAMSGKILAGLIAAYCSELASAYQYEFARLAALGKARNWFVSECEKHRDEEWGHATLLADRIDVLGGTLPFDLIQVVRQNPATVAQETENNRDTEVLRQQILVAEQEAVEIYTALEEMTRDADPVTNDMIIGILATEQDHVVDMIKIGYTIQAE